MNDSNNGLWNFIEKLTYNVFRFGFKLTGKELTDEKLAAFMQFVKFGIVGVSNTVISYVTYIMAFLFFKKLNIFVRSDYLIAQIVAFVLSVLWSFYWNNRVVFAPEEGKQRSLLKTLLKTYVSYSFTGLFLNSILIILWVKVLGISEFLAPVINLLISVPINFLINKFWAYKV